MNYHFRLIKRFIDVVELQYRSERECMGESDLDLKSYLITLFIFVQL